MTHPDDRPRRGRPPSKGETRTCQLRVRCLPSSVAAWKEAAEAAGVTLSEWLHDLADAAVADD